MKKFKVIGVMSGTSLDGLDIALCEFEKVDDNWKSSINDAVTIRYDDLMREKLNRAHHLNGYDLSKFDIDYGVYIGKQIKDFIKNKKVKVDFISSHGHTVFHNPKELITLQIGNGAAIAATTFISTVANFRILDVVLNGQGAPLVPIGDQLLFNEYDYCLNLGGFANISYSWYRKRLAFDICPVNIVINKLAHELDLEFDKDGIEARKGMVHVKLLKELNQLSYYNQNPPKSLGREWVEEFFYKIVEKYDLSINDALRTIYEHIVFQVSRSLTGSVNKKVLITGGGAHNIFLIELLKKCTNHKIIVPNKLLVDYKEALIFAFLGVLRMREEYNCLSSVTGATHDNIGGAIYKI
jgi:anhydro-N-acetylmuramic acid kinase